LPSADLRVGVVGLGFVGAGHVERLAGLPGVRVGATADARPALGDHDDWRRLLADDRLDAVVVATPPDTHRELALAALEAGLPLYLEKPLAHSLADGEAIAAAAAASGTVCAVGYQYRSLSFLDALPRDSAMLLGVGISPTADRPWLGDPSRGGTHLLERASHLIDLELALAGPARRVTAADYGERLALTLELRDDALGTVAVGRFADGPGWRLELVGERGTTTVALGDAPFACGPDGRREHEGGPLLERSLGRFVEAVRADDPGLVPCGPDDALETLATALACLAAAQSGRGADVARRNA
jgi:predicted dehydrogenase